MDNSKDPPTLPEDKPGAPPSFEVATAPSGPSQPAAFRTRFGCITLNKSDRIRFINFFEGDIDAFTDVIRSAWSRGIQDTRKYAQSHEFQLYGRPWKYENSGNDEARRLTRKILEALFNRGWVLQAAVDLSKKDFHKDSLVFRHQSPAPPPCDWMIISFDRHDRLKFVEAPPQDLVAALLNVYGSSVSRHELRPSCLEIKFHGSPWWASGEETVAARMILLRLLEVLEHFGYSVYACIDQQNGTQGHDADVLVVHRQKSWVPGMPVWHR